MDYAIGELAARFGLAPHVLRHWEDMGLLSPTRQATGRRVYGPADVTRVSEILLGKEAGFSLEQLRELFAAPDRAGRRALLRSQLVQVRERIARLTLSQTMLEHAVRCRHPDYHECPRFQEMADAAVPSPDHEHA
ncbi:MerR family transcriptional regulator [Actinoplanes sp. G11-F43]|uniref:MerR family transcriptional regulator n=1 Tax=Actinoplanes sp. G11-F43 TaxID=3424130 RepID=UPI003D3291ED